MSECVKDQTLIHLFRHSYPAGNQTRSEQHLHLPLLQPHRGWIGQLQEMFGIYDLRHYFSAFVLFETGEG